MKMARLFGWIKAKPAAKQVEEGLQQEIVGLERDRKNLVEWMENATSDGRDSDDGKRLADLDFMIKEKKVLLAASRQIA